MIDMTEMFKVFQQHRGNAIVVPGRGGRHWGKISTLPTRDVPMGDPAMGGHASFAFGLALAQPDQKVIVFDSEGDLQMSLGALSTVAELQPKNFCHFLLDNECYATTGGQPVPNAGKIAYDVIARGAGYPHVFAFDNLETFAVNIERVLALPGPVFAALKIIPEIQNEPIGNRPKWSVRSRDQILRDLRQDLGIAG